MKKRYATLILGLCLTSTQALASAFPNEVLQNEYAMCMENMNKEGITNVEKQKTYCECAINQMAQLWDYEEYSLFTANGGIAPEGQAKLNAISDACVAETLQK